MLEWMAARGWIGFRPAANGKRGFPVQDNSQESVVAFAFVWCIVFRMPMVWKPYWELIAAMKIVAIIGSLAGGVLGGSTARFRSER